MNNLSVVLPVLLLFISMTNTANAYVDPGSGSIIITTVLGLIAAIGYTFRKIFYKTKRLIFGNKSEDKMDGKD